MALKKRETKMEWIHIDGVEIETQTRKANWHIDSFWFSLWKTKENFLIDRVNGKRDFESIFCSKVNSAKPLPLHYTLSKLNEIDSGTSSYFTRCVNKISERKSAYTAYLIPPILFTHTTHTHCVATLNMFGQFHCVHICG